MAAGGVGYWGAGYWHIDLWHDGYWAGAGAVPPPPPPPPPVGGVEATPGWLTREQITRLRGAMPPPVEIEGAATRDGSAALDRQESTHAARLDPQKGSAPAGAWRSPSPLSQPDQLARLQTAVLQEVGQAVDARRAHQMAQRLRQAQDEEGLMLLLLLDEG